jgi:hypothetical protein
VVVGQCVFFNVLQQSPLFVMVIIHNNTFVVGSGLYCLTNGTNILHTVSIDLCIINCIKEYSTVRSHSFKYVQNSLVYIIFATVVGTRENDCLLDSIIVCVAFEWK